MVFGESDVFVSLIWKPLRLSLFSPPIHVRDWYTEIFVHSFRKHYWKYWESTDVYLLRLHIIPYCLPPTKLTFQVVVVQPNIWMLSSIPLIGFLLMFTFLSRTMFIFFLDHGAHNKWFFFKLQYWLWNMYYILQWKKKTQNLSLIRFTCKMVDPSVGPLVNMKKHLIYAKYQCHSNNGKSFRSFVSLDTHTALPVLCRITTQRSSCSHRVCFRRRGLELTNPETFTQETVVFIKCPNLDAVGW